MAEEEAQPPAPDQDAGPATAAPEGEAQPQEDGEVDPWESVGEDSPNDWEGMREGVRLLGEGELAPSLTPEVEPAEAEGDAQPEGEAEPEAEAEPDIEASEEPEPEAEDQGSEHYTAVEAESGEPTDVEWRDGVEIQFKADGEEHSVESMEELVQLAQKGVAFDRKSQEFSDTRRQLKQQLSRVEEAAQEQRQKANKIIKAILTDEDAYAHYYEELQKLEDPEYQELVEKARKGEQVEREEELQEERQREQAVEQFQARVSEEIEGNLDEFDYLRESDEPIIQHHFYALQEQAYEQLLDQYQSEADRLGLDQDEVRQRAYAESMQVLHEDNLRKVMEALDEEIRDRVGENGRQGSPDSGPEGSGNRDEGPEAAKREVEDRNRYTDEKLEQKKRGPGVRSGGAAPGGSGLGDTRTDRQEGETAFDAALRGMREQLDEARRG